MSSMSANTTPGITALILTFNEEQHIARCIESLKPVVERICIVDSYSKDRTVEIAKALGADVLQNPWKNYATQFQFGLDNAGITTAWTMRIDSDEYLEPGLQQEIREFLINPGSINAVYFRRKMVFLGQPITHGFFYPAMMLRLWRSGQGTIEPRWMDEHIVVDNAVAQTLNGGDLVDANLNNLAWWTNKHVGYARREVYDIVATREKIQQVDETKLSGQAKYKRFLKDQIYARLPSAVRGAAYFGYRYFLGAGFLDGKAGFFFHFLQGFWYRTYVDAVMFELEREAHAKDLTLYEYLKQQGVYDA